MAGQVWGVNSQGGFLATASLDATIRQRATATTYFYNTSVALTSYGRGRGDTLLFDKAGRLVTAMSSAGLAETTPIPETDFPIVQGSIVSTEYGNAVPWTEKLDDFAQSNVGSLVAAVLKQDQIEGLDIVASAAYIAAAKVIYTPTSATGGVFSTTGTPGAVASNAMATPHVKDITDYLRRTKVPAFSTGRYLGIGNVQHLRGIKDSSDFVSVHTFNDPDKLYSHEVGEWGGVRFVEENNVLVYPAGTSTVLGQGVYIGADNVVQAVALAPHLRYKIPSQFGRDRGMAHYCNMGFTKVWNYNTDSGEDHEILVSSS